MWRISESLMDFVFFMAKTFGISLNFRSWNRVKHRLWIPIFTYITFLSIFQENTSNSQKYLSKIIKLKLPRPLPQHHPSSYEKFQFFFRISEAHTKTLVSWNEICIGKVIFIYQLLTFFCFCFLIYLTENNLYFSLVFTYTQLSLPQNLHFSFGKQERNKSVQCLSSLF